MPGKQAQIRLPHGRTQLNLIAVYQTVVRTTASQQGNMEQRASLLTRLGALICLLPSRNTLEIAGDMNTSLLPGPGVGPSLLKGTSHPDSERFTAFLSEHGLTALNTWSSRQIATYVSAQGSSQIDYMCSCETGKPKVPGSIC